MRKLVLACMSAGDLATIHDLSRRGDHTVIAVAFDLGDARLRELHDQARLAGAERCHVIDVREEFAGGYVLPAIHRGTALTVELLGALAASCVEKKLQQVAELEGDAQVKAPAFVSISGAVPVMPVAIDRGADVEVTFEAGTPVAISRVPMSVFELIECLNTIGGAHGVASPHPGWRLLQCAYRALDATAEPSSGVVRLEIHQGRVLATRSEYAAT